jgi:acetyltransferase-like isoleucine patch superfamily enzyme
MSIKIHPTADVHTKLIGEGTTIWQNCVILKDAMIGKNCNINFNVFIENDVVIGDNVTIKHGVQIWDGIRLGNNDFVGPNATFTNDILPRSKQYPERFEKTIINDGASIGANATILAGITIGQYTMIGAGSVVTKSTSPYTLWYGNPAKHKGYVTKEGRVISLNLKDKAGNSYVLVNNEPVTND